MSAPQRQGNLRRTALDADVIAQAFARTRHHTRRERRSPGERDVLDQRAQGRSNPGAARALRLGEGAVHRHVTTIFTELDLDPSEGHRRAQEER